MQRFTELYLALDRTTRTAEKVAALVQYFASTPPADAAWALYFLTGNRVKRLVPTARLRDWMADAAELPLWLVEESYDAVGDLAEALALLAPPHGQMTRETLSELIEQRMLALQNLPLEQQRSHVQQAWRELSLQQCLVWHKLITGEFRVGVARTLVVRALAEVAGLPSATMAHRLMGTWQPSAEAYASLLGEGEAEADPGRPYPFFLAHPLESPLAALGAIGDWQAEWKWDGIRAQAIRRAGQFLIWSRGEELVTDRFPELSCLAHALSDGTVLDGEILAWDGRKPLPFAALQTRISRKKLTAKVLAASPVEFMAYDLLEADGSDLRSRPLAERRGRLEALIAAATCAPLRLSEVVAAPDWNELESLWRGSRERHVEGLMLKRRDSAYGVGRPRGDWWKWKIEPYSIDAVLIYAQRGSGRRASLYTDYTFGLWENGALVPMAKAYSGLTDDEIHEVDAFVRRSTLERFGPVRVVKPELVFELHFEGIQTSGRHKSGLAVRFPRMARWRREKRPEEADTLDNLRRLLTPPPS